MLGAIVTLCMAFGVGVFVGASTNKAEPGSSGDPLITKSYLEQRLTELGKTTTSSSSTEEIKALQQENENLKKQVQTLQQEIEKQKFKKVTIKKGKSLVVKYGSQFVFYSGQASFKTTNNSYIVDLTKQEHVANGASATMYHNYLIRSQSSLVAVKDAVVYVRGNYTVQ